jgi:hypothetical protein
MGCFGRDGNSIGAPLRYDRNNGIMEYWNDDLDEVIFKFIENLSTV